MNDSLVHIATVGGKRQPIRSVAGYLWSRTGKVNELLRIMRELETWPGVEVTPCRNGLSLTVDGETFGHVDWKGRIVVSLRREIRDCLVAEGVADLDPGELECVVFRIRVMAEVKLGLWLLRMGYRHRGKPIGAIPLTVSLSDEREPDKA